MAVQSNHQEEENVFTVTFAPFCHRPLGCTIEESLARNRQENESTARRKHGQVFVSKVTPSSYADKAGLQIGDVIVDVTGIFGELQDVRNLGIDAV
jgi:predicted metalloprotease with PDZ domain